MHGFPDVSTRRSGWHDLSVAERAALTRIYEDSFPPAERNPVARFGTAGIDFWLALDGARRLVAFAAVGRLAGGAYLQYLAVDRSVRNRGVGAALLDVLAADLAALGQRYVLLEIEDPQFADDPPMAERRRGFYVRWGAEPVAGLAGYHIPDRVEPDTAVPMVLLARPSAPDVPPLRGAELRSVLRQLYEFEYAEFAPAGYLDRILAGAG